MQKTSIADLKPLLKEAKIKHWELADATGFYRETVTCWLNGKPISDRRAGHIRNTAYKLIADKNGITTNK